MNQSYTFESPQTGDYVQDTQSDINSRRVLVHRPVEPASEWTVVDDVPVTAFNPECDPYDPVGVTAFECELEKYPGWRDRTPQQLWQFVQENDIQHYSCPYSRLRRDGIAVGDIDIYFDGSGRDKNPEWGTYGYVIRRSRIFNAESGVIKSDKGTVTSITSEYAGLVNAVEEVAEAFPDSRILVRGDCKPVIHQVENGVIPLKNIHQDLWLRAQKAIEELDITFVKIDRDNNEKAHALAYSEYLKQVADLDDSDHG